MNRPVGRIDRGLQAVIDHLESDGCPRCGELPGTIAVNGPSEIVLDCGHVIDATAWIHTDPPTDRFTFT